MDEKLKSSSLSEFVRGLKKKGVHAELISPAKSKLIKWLHSRSVNSSSTEHLTEGCVEIEGKRKTHH
ncbi:hypothetical protein GJU40_05625 [Bacillus lacus]|uniref:Uncharacterized protein n=1 Tax=Metabacillus lacus TaxID=1983721 RepID=A0A7X2IYU4_9BACI|nr:hypothetical protein [Metabacillus lacus]MRX71653.1 hypothetical protein [Metabacillus lacus]